MEASPAPSAVSAIKSEISEDSSFSADTKKRKRKREVDNLEIIESGGRAAKRRASSQLVDAPMPTGPCVSLGQQTPEEVRSTGLQLWNAIKDHEHAGRLLSPIFMKLPSRKAFPDYYTIIKRPIAMDEIKSKLDKLMYQSMDQVQSELNLIFANAQQYNAPGSVVFEDAQMLQKLIQTTMMAMGGEMLDADGKPKEAEAPTLTSWLNKKLEDITFWQDNSGRYLSEVFMALPDRDKYPDYYNLIPQPVSFDIVQGKINQKAYPTERSFIQDVNGIFKNAKYYNQERSPIWKDAAKLEQLFAEMMKETPPNFGPKSGASDGKPRITLKLKPPASEVTRRSPKQEEMQIKQEAVVEPPRAAPAPRRTTPVPPPVGVPPAPRQDLLDPPGPRIYRERVLAGIAGKPCVSSIHVRCRPVGPMLELPTAELRQHAIVLPRAVETVEVVPMGTLNIRATSRPLIKVVPSHDTVNQYLVFILHPSPEQPLTTLELFARSNDGTGAEQVYRLFLQRLPV